MTRLLCVTCRMYSIQVSSMWSELPCVKTRYSSPFTCWFLAYFCYTVAFVRRLYICEYVIIDKEVDF